MSEPKCYETETCQCASCTPKHKIWTKKELLDLITQIVNDELQLSFDQSEDYRKGFEDATRRLYLEVQDRGAQR